MKTLKTMMLGLALLITCSFAKAAQQDEADLTKDYAINTYVNAMTHGKLKEFSAVLDQDVKFSMLRGTTVLNFTRSEMLESLKASKDTEQACTTSTSTVESNDALAIVKVDMKFDGFTRSNFVTVTNTGKGWKITNVYSVFK